MLPIMQWVLKRGFQLLALFLLIVTILALWQNLPGRVAEWQREAVAIQSTSDTLTASQGAFAQQADSAVRSADAEIERLRGATAAQLDIAARDIADRRRRTDARILSPTQLALAAAQGSSERILASYRAEYVDSPVLTRAAALVALRRQNLATAFERQSLASATAAHERQRQAFNARVRQRNALAQLARTQRRDPLCRSVAVPVVCTRVIQLRQMDSELDTARAALAASAQTLAGRRAAVRAMSLQRETVADSAQIAREANRALAQRVDALSADAASRAPNLVRSALKQHGLHAALLVLLAVLLPPVYAMFRYFVLARLIDRSTGLTLRDAGPGSAASRSETSIQVPIDSHTELLLRSGVQERAVHARADDVLVLDWSIPLTCLAAGLVNLQRFKSPQPDHVTVSAADGEQHHELALVTVPAGGAVVLKPRALIGVIKPRGERLVIERRWRFGSLVSWMTMQFRYLIFAGPCTLIVQGNRGVQVTQATDGRAISRRLVLGFDAGLAYSAVRSASFRPYLFGQASLFDDRFDGTGSYIHQPRPDGAVRRGFLGRGLKGVGDAVLNAFGV
ncbi:hypothetical protein [Blastomonas sp.]|uniref:hypothetical protein n=1 Tax=Blastomonas sp. TaxID=1909299 RepID=UPI002630B536|nr:hypothetical protein [Blastomonas sp.]MDM7955487.1 hypothetical protein [Blastomonas sp.]